MSNELDLNKLTINQTAILYSGLGFNTMPLQSGTKRPALCSWKYLIILRANPELFRRWFDGTNNNIAILTGKISRLLVLDFDKVDLYLQFISSFPDLARSYTVQTRRGFHIYLRVPENLNVGLKGCKGIDVMWEGRYVVAPPSIVDGYQYQVKNSGEMVEIDQSHLDRLSAFLSQFQKQRQLVHSDPINAGKGAYNATVTPIKPSITEAELSSLYRHHAPLEGRNQALFRLACLGRDSGLSEYSVRQALVTLHTHQPAMTDHSHESTIQRKREAKRTIESAFSKPPRPNSGGQSIHEQVPNHIVEALFMRGFFGVMLVLLGLRLMGKTAGTTFTAQEAVELLKGIVGRDTVYRVLNWLESVSPVPPSKMSNDIAIKQANSLTSKCKKVRVKKPVITRSARVFTMPSNAQLAAILGCQIGPVLDQLTLEDLQSAKILRQVYHARFIRRRPGKYPNALIAKRIGVCKRTVQNYNAANKNIHSSPQYDEKRVFWSNFEALIPDELPHDGFFLTDTWGKRYPAKREIAKSLLRRKHKVTLWRQVANMYWYGDLPMPPIAQPTPEPVPIFQRQTYHIAPAPTSIGRKPSTSTPQAPYTPSIVQRTAPADDPEAIERFAHYLYEQINALPTEQGGKLSLKRARQMVEQYGVAKVKNALQRTVKRKKIYKPVGFLTTLLRSEAKKY